MPASPAHPRLRRDLVFSRVVQHGETSVMVKDPLANAYFKLDEISGVLAQQMDGSRSVDDLVAWAGERWPSVEFDTDYMDDLVRELGKLKLLDDPFERSALVMQRARDERPRLTASMLENVTNVKLGVFNPDRVLDATYPRLAFAFRRPVVLGVVALFALSVFVLFARWDHLGFNPRAFFIIPGAPLPALLLLWVILLLTTVGHEFGHAYTLKHQGCRVNRMGFMLMFGAPCLFCDMSDIHLLDSWKARTYVALGGIYADLAQAVAATALWWATPDGTLVNQVAARVMLWCGITGIVMNANPLMKLDGYFVLAEYLDISELRDEAFRYTGYLVRRYLLGIPVECPVRGRARKRVLVIYAALSLCYTGMILTFFYLWVRGVLVGWLAFAGALASVYVFYLFFKRSIHNTVKTARLWVLTHGERIRRRPWGWALGGGALALIALPVPYPGVLTRPVTLEPGRQAPVSAPEELFLLEARFRGGDRVQAGDTLAVLDAREYQVDAAGSERRSLARERQAWAARAAGAPGEAAGADALGRGDAGEAAAYRARAHSAVLRAPIAGRILTLGQLDRVGERLEAGETLCVVGDMRALRASLELAQQEVVDMRPGAPARARLLGSPGVVLRGRVSQVGWEPIETRSGRRYRVWLTLEGREGVKAGQGAVARIHTPARSAASHFLRWLTGWLRTDLLV